MTEAQARSYFMFCSKQLRMLERAVYSIALSGDRLALQRLTDDLQLARAAKTHAFAELQTVKGTTPRRPVRLRARA